MSRVPDDVSMRQGSGSEPPRSLTTLSVRSLSPAKPSSVTPLSRARRFEQTLERLGFKEDYRGRLHPLVSRFLGYRHPDAVPPYEPFPILPFTWLKKIPLRYEVWLFAWVGAFCNILLIESIMSTSTAFRNVYHAPIIITSFGASAILTFGVIESPLAQPRSLFFGQFVSSVISVAITRLWVLNPGYTAHLDSKTFYPPIFVNGGLCMATSLLVQLMLGIVHPPGGATGLGAAIEADVVALSWHYVPVILASTLITLGWALIVNNLGRRRYPIYWWSPESSFISSTAKNAVPQDEERHMKNLEEGKLRRAEDGGRTAEALYEERINEDSSMHKVDSSDTVT